VRRSCGGGINGEEHGGNDSEDDNKGGKGNGGRVYEDNEDEGHDGTVPEGGGSLWSSSGSEGAQQSNIKPTSTARDVVVMTARAMTKVARATVAGATKMMVTMVTTATTAAMATTKTPNGDKDNEDGICRRQQCRDSIHRSKSAGKCNRQLISQGGHGLLNSRGRASPHSWRDGKCCQQLIS
jgi:hypothetical protein